MLTNLHISMTSFLYESRVLKETESLLRSGLVQHVCIAALHEDGLKEHEEIDSDRSVWRVSLKSRKWSRSLLVQIIKYLEFCFRLIGYARSKNIAMVNVHCLGLLPLGVLLKWICRAKLVYDAHELETETNGLCGIRQVLSRYVERNLIKYADLVIVVADGINGWYRGKYGLSNIVTVINCPEYKEPRHSRRLHRELSIPEDRRIVIYQGVLSKGRGIEKLLKTFEECNDGKLVLVLMGEGELEPLIRGFADSHDNIYFQKAVPPNIVLEYTASADIGISYIDNTCLSYNWCLPNKFFEYISAGLPVIVNNLPEMRRVVNENQIGIVLDEFTPRTLKSAFEEIARMNVEKLSRNLHQTAQEYSWSNQAETMIAAYRQHVFRK